MKIILNEVLKYWKSSANLAFVNQKTELNVKLEIRNKVLRKEIRMRNEIRTICTVAIQPDIFGTDLIFTRPSESFQLFDSLR